MSGDDRIVLVDASVVITLAGIDAVSLLRGLRGELRVPVEVAREVLDPPATDILRDADWIGTSNVGLSSSVQTPEMASAQKRAEAHLGREADGNSPNGDVAILALAVLQTETYDREVVILTDDKPLRETCKALSIPVSGSIGVLVRAVERGDFDSEDAKSALEAMDEVGARLSVSLLKRAERLIDEAAQD